MTHIGVSQHFRPQPLGTLFVTSNLSTIVLANDQEGHLLRYPKKNCAGFQNGNKDIDRH